MEHPDDCYCLDCVPEPPDDEEAQYRRDEEEQEHQRDLAEQIEAALGLPAKS